MIYLLIFWVPLLFNEDLRFSNKGGIDMKKVGWKRNKIYLLPKESAKQQSNKSQRKLLV